MGGGGGGYNTFLINEFTSTNNSQLTDTFRRCSNSSKLVTTPTIQTVSDRVSLITSHNAYISTNKNKIIRNEMELLSRQLFFFKPGRTRPAVFTCMTRFSVASTHIYNEIQVAAILLFQHIKLNTAVHTDRNGGYHCSCCCRAFPRCID